MWGLRGHRVCSTTCGDILLGIETLNALSWPFHFFFDFLTLRSWFCKLQTKPSQKNCHFDFLCKVGISNTCDSTSSYAMSSAYQVVQCFVLHAAIRLNTESCLLKLEYQFQCHILQLGLEETSRRSWPKLFRVCSPVQKSKCRTSIHPVFLFERRIAFCSDLWKLVV